jgi:hypothetical protein
MANHTGKGFFKKGVSGNPGGRPKLPAEIREMFQARSQEALEVLIRCLQSDDERIAMMAAQAILDRGYGKPTQLIDANITEDGGPVRYYAELPRKADTVAAWLEHVNARVSASDVNLIENHDAHSLTIVGADVGARNAVNVEVSTKSKT